MMSSGLNDMLSQAVDQYENEEVVLDEGLDEIIFQSLDMFKQKSLEDDALQTCLRLEGLVW